MYTVGVSYSRPAGDEVGEVEFSLEKNPDETLGQIPTDEESSEDYHKVIGEVISILVAHPSLDKISFTMRE